MAPAKAALAFCLLYTTAAVYSASDVLEIEEGNELGAHDEADSLENNMSFGDEIDSDSTESEELSWSPVPFSEDKLNEKARPGLMRRRKSVCRCKGTVCHCCGTDGGILLCVNIRYHLGYFHVSMFAMNKLFYTGTVMYENPKILCGMALGIRICVQIQDGRKHHGKVYGCLKIRSPVPKSYPCFRMKTRSLE